MIRRFKMQLLVWLTMTETGEFSEIGQLYRHVHFVADICHDGQLSKRSLFYQEDFWRLGQEKVKTSRVILTNHAYLLTRLEDDKSLLQESVLKSWMKRKTLLCFGAVFTERRNLAISSFKLATRN